MCTYSEYARIQSTHVRVYARASVPMFTSDCIYFDLYTRFHASVLFAYAYEHGRRERGTLGIVRYVILVSIRLCAIAVIMNASLFSGMAIYDRVTNECDAKFLPHVIAGIKFTLLLAPINIASGFVFGKIAKFLFE